MDKKTSISTSKEATDSFNMGLESIKQVTSALPNVSPEDKKGGKLTKKVSALITKAIENAPSFENNLPRDFVVQDMVDDQQTIADNEKRIEALKAEIRRLEDVNTFVGIRLYENYRTVHKAGVKTAQKVAALKTTVDELGAPFKKKPSADGKKTDKTAKKTGKAAKKTETVAENA